MSKQYHIAVVGSGPAGLMVSSVLSSSNFRVSLFEKKRGPAAKFLIAGKSGLNISNRSSNKKLEDWYLGPKNHFKALFEKFGCAEWIHFIESLGIKTFLGTSERYFVEGLKAAPLLKAWMDQLKERGTTFYYNQEIDDFRTEDGKVWLKFSGSSDEKEFDAACFCLGGASWEPSETPISWPKLFSKKKINIQPFEASNAGYEVSFSKDLLKKLEGKHLKNILVTSDQGSQKGEIFFTEYGVEGTPIYSLKNSQKIFLDLKPDLRQQEIFTKLNQSKENLSPLRRIKKYLKLSEAALDLLYHHFAGDEKPLSDWVKVIKKYPIPLSKKRPLSEAISSSGGVSWSELDKNLMLKKFPRIFVAGEMINWDAPTGGFLIQACVSQGYWAGEAIKNLLNEASV